MDCKRRNKTNSRETTICSELSLQPFNDIDLLKEENYDCSASNVWSYRKSNDIRDGINLRFGNMCNGYPILIAGVHFHNAECAYISGAYSDAGEQTLYIQRMIAAETNGQKCKRIFRRREEFTFYHRKDFDTFKVQWMLYIVWQKCLQNTSFAGLLKKIPIDAHLVENTTLHNSSSAMFWGARNQKLMSARRLAGEKAETQMNFRFKKDRLHARMMAENSVNRTDCFTGRNVMGKILKLCSLALIFDREPPIDVDLLRSAQIYMAGSLMNFTELETLQKNAVTGSNNTAKCS